MHTLMHKGENELKFLKKYFRVKISINFCHKPKGV